MPHECDIYGPGIKANVLSSINMEVTPDGATPAFDIGELSGSGDKLHYWGAPIETKNPSGNPRLYAFCNESVWYVESGTLTEDNDFGADLGTAVVQGLLIFPDTGGNKRLIAFFGTSTYFDANGGHWWRNLGTDTTPWTEHAGATAITAFGAINVGPDAFLVTGGTSVGRTVLSDWKLSKIVQGVYDGTTTNIGAAEPAGNGDWPLIGLAALRQSAIAGTGAGAFYRNAVDKIWEPIRPLQERLPHGLNCKVMVPSENGGIYAMNDGRLFEYDGATEHEITPLKDSRKPKDIQRGRISFAADRGDVLAVGYEVAQSCIKGTRFAALGGRFFRRTSGTWTEITTDVTDSNLQTPASANMNAWGGTATDRLLVTSPFPLSCIIPRVTRNANAAVNSFTNPQGSSTSAETAGSLSVDLGTVIDNTILSISGVSLALTGFPPAAAEPMLGWTSTTAWQDVGKTSALTITGIAGSPLADVYAYEWSPTNTTAMTTTTTIDEIDVVPARPGLRLNDTSGPFTAANDFSSLAASGMLTEIYFGRRIGTGNYEWSNPYTLYTKAGGILTAAWTTSPTGALTNGGSGLILFGRMGQYIIAEGQTRDPRRTRYPRLCQWTTTEPGPTLALNDIVFRENDGTLANANRPKRIMQFKVYGEDIPPDDLIKPLVRYHHGRGWHKFATAQGTVPLISSDINPERRGGGYKADVKLLYSDTNQTDLWAPLISRVRIVWDYADSTMAAPPETPAVE